MKTVTRSVIGIGLTSIWSEAALARRSDREGLNFGTSIRTMDSDDRGQKSAVSDKETRTKSSGQAFSPYLGYAFGPINLGLMLNLENKYEEFSESNPTTNQTLSRNASTASKAGSIFSRFNFGKIMFFEVGGGMYSQSTNVHTELRSSTGDSFSGTTQDYKLAGMGPGYHMGGGIELPADNGFYFTGSYMVHNYQLHDTAHSSYGSVIGNQQKRELSFGISYYN